VWTDPVEWFWGFSKWAKLIGETVVIAYLGTVIGTLGAFCLCFLAASNLATRTVTRQLTLRFLEFCRTVPELVFALLFVASFGLGPLPGVLALAIHTLGALGKQFCEVVENADMKPFEGVTATGATWSEGVRFAILPQVMSNFTSYGLLRFEINVRESAILGFVGAGGIGQELLVAVRRFYYSDVSAIVLMIVATVAIMDLATGAIRRRLLGEERAA
jgi:phosphonate transport system permease protein